MKVLWISNALVSDQGISSTGTWLVALYDSIKKFAPRLFVVNAVPTPGCSAPENISTDNIQQYRIPQSCRIDESTLQSVCDMIKSLNIDLIHIWGTENCWAYHLISAELKLPLLIEMQGILSTVKENYLGGLSVSTLLKNITLRDLLRYKTSLYNISAFDHMIEKENIIIRDSDYIAYQSEWVRDWLQAKNNKAKLYSSNIVLRNDFYSCGQWAKERSYRKFSIVCISSFDYPLKGGHVLLEALAILKDSYPNIELRVAGKLVPRWKYTSYDKYIRRKIKRLGLEHNVRWCGPLNSKELIDLLEESTVFVCPSYIESYSLATAEALMIGIPTLTSCSGALPEFQKYGSLCFSVGDYRQCAEKIDFLFQHPEIAEEISVRNRQKLIEKYDQSKAVKKIYNMYLDIISSKLK